MENGTFHYVQRMIGEIETQPTEEHPEVWKQEVWTDVPFVDAEGNVVGAHWRSRRFVTASNYIDALRKQDATPERYRLVKRTFHEEVITPRWHYVEHLTIDPVDGDRWERIQHGDVDWRCRTYTAAKDYIRAVLENPEQENEKFRIIGPEGEVEGEFTRSDFTYDEDEPETCEDCGELIDDCTCDEDEDEDDDDKLTETLESQVGDVPNEN